MKRFKTPKDIQIEKLTRGIKNLQDIVKHLENEIRKKARHVEEKDQEILELRSEIDQFEQMREEEIQRGFDECTRGVLDYMRLVQGGMLPIEAASIVQHSHDLDQELIDEMYRFQMPELKLTLPKPAKKPKRKK